MKKKPNSKIVNSLDPWMVTPAKYIQIIAAGIYGGYGFQQASSATSSYYFKIDQSEGKYQFDESTALGAIELSFTKSIDLGPHTASTTALAQDNSTGDQRPEITIVDRTIVPANTTTVKANVTVVPITNNSNSN